MSNPVNYREECASCGDAHESGYRPLVHLPPAWVLLLANEYGLRDHLWTTAFIELCETCLKRFDYLKVQSWQVYDPDALDTVTTEWALRINPDDLIDVN